MTLPALATIEGLDARGVDVSDAPRARAAIEDVSALIHHETGYQWVDGDDLAAGMPAVVTTIAYKVIRRALSNPDDIESEQLGPFQQTRRQSDGDVYLTTSEKETLQGTLGNKTGLSTLRLEAPWPTIRRETGYFAADAGSVE